MVLQMGAAADAAEADRTPAREPALPWARIRVAVIIPCRDQAGPISAVIGDFRAALPGATIYVYDNDSEDGSADAARAAGAVVRHEAQPGRGAVVRRLFADIDADIYVLVTGDDRYDAASAPYLIRLLLDGPLDMVTAARDSGVPGGGRTGTGSPVLTWAVAQLFGKRIGDDLLSGYRVFSRRFVKSFPDVSKGFDIETELAVHALELRMPIAEVKTRYRPPPAVPVGLGQSVRKGIHCLRTIGMLVLDEKPMGLFAGVAGILGAVAAALALPIVLRVDEVGPVAGLPGLALAIGLVILAALSVAGGILLHIVSRGRKEMKRLHYLAIQPPPWIPFETEWPQ